MEVDIEKCRECEHYDELTTKTRKIIPICTKGFPNIVLKPKESKT